MTFLRLLTRTWPGEPLALGCIPPARTHSTARLLTAAHVHGEPGSVIGLTHAEATRLDAELDALAALTAETDDPPTAAWTLYGDPR